MLIAFGKFFMMTNVSEYCRIIFTLMMDGQNLLASLLFFLHFDIVCVIYCIYSNEVEVALLFIVNAKKMYV